MAELYQNDVLVGMISICRGLRTGVQHSELHSPIQSLCNPLGRYRWLVIRAERHVHVLVLIVHAAFQF